MSDLAMSWHLVITACSLYMLCRNDSLRTSKLMILEPFRTNLLSVIKLSLISQYLWVTLGACLHVAAIHCAWACRLWAAPAADSLLTYLDQTGVTEGNVNHTQIKEVSSLCHMPESLDRASGSCISLSGLFIIVASYCCRWRNILWRWGVWLLNFSEWSSERFAVRLYSEGEAVEVGMEVITYVDYS